MLRTATIRSLFQVNGDSVDASRDPVETTQECPDRALGGDQLGVDVALHVRALALDERGDPHGQVVHGRGDRIEFVLH